MFLVEIPLKILHLKKCFDLLFLYFYREGSVIAEISLTFDEPVGESEVESLLLDAINDGSLDTLKVDTFPIGSIISGVYKLSTTVIGSGPNESGLTLWWTNISARVSNIFVMFLHGGCASKSAHPLSTNSQVLTERALSLVDDIIVFKNFLKFYPIVITEVRVTCGFSYSGRKTSELKWKKDVPYHGMNNAPIKFAWDFHKKYDTSSLLLNNPYGKKTGQTKRESLFAGKYSQGI